jgi:hypothetical protein
MPDDFVPKPGPAAENLAFHVLAAFVRKTADGSSEMLMTRSRKE